LREQILLINFQKKSSECLIEFQLLK
jgi:hypothetical protein